MFCNKTGKWISSNSLCCCSYTKSVFSASKRKCEIDRERFPLFLPSYETPSSEAKNYESFLPLPLKERNWNWLYKNIYIFPLVLFLYLRCFHPRKHGTKKNRFKTKPVSFAVQTQGKESAQRNSGEQVRTNYDPYASFFQYFTEAELGACICIGLNMAIPLLNSMIIKIRTGSDFFTAIGFIK